MIDSIVSITMENKRLSGEKEEYDKFKDKLKLREEWKTKHTIKDIRVGDKLDVRDTEYVWCKAVVEMKIVSENRKPLLYIHYEGWNRKYDEYMYIDSPRLSPQGLYTGRVDIPKYYMCPHSNQMYGHIVEGGEQRGVG